MENKDKLIDLGNGYAVEIIETIPDKKGNKWEGYLYHNGMMLDEVVDNGLYKTQEELVLDYTNIILPNYIREHKITSIKGLGTAIGIYDFVDEHILTNKITWGMTIDVLKVLESNGYKLPTVEDEAFTIEEYEMYLETVTAISLQFTKQLNSFGFGCDRNMSNTVHHKQGNKHKSCRNIIYTRYPWTNGYKMSKAMTTVKAMVTHNYLAGKDLKKLGTAAPVITKSLRTMGKVLKTDGGCVLDVLAGGFDKAFLEFDTLVTSEQDKLVTQFSKWSPVKYEEYFANQHNTN